jgi:hypothetical protein
MKLTELHTEVLWEGEIGGEDYIFCIENGVAQFIQERAGKVPGGIRKGLAFAGKAAMVGLAAGWALDSLKKYNRNKRTTTTFFAKDMQERKLYQGIVDDLMKTGHYKKTHEKYAKGGKIWVLKRKRS